MDAVDLSSLSGDEQTIAKIVALRDYADQTNSQNAANEASALANQAMASGNPYVFSDMSDSTS